MQSKVGLVFEGVISGVTEWGMYVELVENKIEGLVLLKELEGDYYVFDERNFCITGHHTKRKFQLGQTVKVQILRANLQRRQLDFTIAE